MTATANNGGNKALNQPGSASIKRQQLAGTFTATCSIVADVNDNVTQPWYGRYVIRHLFILIVVPLPCHCLQNRNVATSGGKAAIINNQKKAAKRHRESENDAKERLGEGKPQSSGHQSWRRNEGK